MTCVFVLLVVLALEVGDVAVVGEGMAAVGGLESCVVVVTVDWAVWVGRDVVAVAVAVAVVVVAELRIAAWVVDVAFVVVVDVAVFDVAAYVVVACDTAVVEIDGAVVAGAAFGTLIVVVSVGHVVDSVVRAWCVVFVVGVPAVVVAAFEGVATNVAVADVAAVVVADASEVAEVEQVRVA